MFSRRASSKLAKRLLFLPDAVRTRTTPRQSCAFKSSSKAANDLSRDLAVRRRPRHALESGS